MTRMLYKGSLISENGDTFTTVDASALAYALTYLLPVTPTTTKNYTLAKQIAELKREAWEVVTWSPELGMFAAVSDTGTGNRVMTSKKLTGWPML